MSEPHIGHPQHHRHSEPHHAEHHEHSDSEPMHSESEQTTRSLPLSNARACCNPCPCTTLKMGSRIIAIVEILFSCMHIIMSGVVFLFVVEIPLMRTGKTFKDTSKFQTSMAMGYIFSVIAFPIFVARLILAVYLYLGATQMCRWKAMVYLIGIPVCVVVTIKGMIILYIIQLFGKSMADEITISTMVAIAYIFFYMSLCVYFMVVVYFFVGELKVKAIQQGLQPVVIPLSYSNITLAQNQH